MEEFDLKLRISPSDTEFKKKIGDEKYIALRNKTFSQCQSVCMGCGFRPIDDNKILSVLSMHVIDFEEENPEEAKCTVLCKACHATQHIDIAIEKGWVELVNSTYSQKSLIEACRLSQVVKSIQEDKTRKLSTPPKEYLEKLKAGTLLQSSKLKVIFTEAFDFGDDL